MLETEKDSTASQSNLPLPPGSNGLPFLGETLAFLLDKNFVAKRYAKYGPVYRTNILNTPTVAMVGPDAARFVLASQFNHFSWGAGWPENFKDLLGRSLFVQDGDEHKRNRKLLLPAFHGKALAGYIQTIEEIVQRYLQKWEQLGQFRWFAEHKQLTFEIACTIFVGVNPGKDTARVSRLFADLTNGLFGIVRVNKGFTRYGKAMKARAELLEFVQQVVQERKRQPGLDALSMLIEARDEEGQGFSDDELAAQALLLLFAGHETTTSMMTSLCWELAENPAVLAKARAEQQTLGVSDPVTFEMAGKMAYLDQVLREVERLRPPVAGGFRGVVKPLEFNGYCIPAGWRVQYSIAGTHKTARYSEPETFDPERFNPMHEEHKQQAFSLIGFGGGPRICLGMAFALLEIKLIASHLLRKYSWEIVPGQNLAWSSIPTLHPKDGLLVNFRRL